MQVDSPEKIRNVAITGHNDTGKTTLVSSLLYATGETNRLGRVEDGHAPTDFDPEEIERGISIGLATAHVPWKQHKINLLDCPGYGIFFSETRAGMKAADTVLLCVNGVSGIEVNTEKVWETAEELDLPLVFHFTKMDRERADFRGTLASLQERWVRTVVPVQLPIGKESGFKGVVDLVHRKAYVYDLDGPGNAEPVEIPEELADEVAEIREQLIESVAETDDELMEEFFEVGSLPEEDLVKGLRRAVRKRQLFPVSMGSGLHGVGMSALLDMLVEDLPSPLERPSYSGVDADGERVEVSTDPDSPPVALVFKTISDPFSGKISLLRVVGGTLKSDSSAYNPRSEETTKVGSLLALEGKQGKAVPHLVAGDVGGVAKLKDTDTGDTLCTQDEPLTLDWIELPEPAMAFAVEPKSKGDEEKIGEALSRLIEEDPTLKVSRDPETHEYLLSGAGQLHIEIATSKLKRRFNVEVILHPPKVPYRETIRRKADGHGRHKKQTGGRGQFADCKITLEPNAEDEFEFVDEIFGGAIPQGYRPAVEMGIQEARRRGYLAGYPVVNFRVRLTDGQYHDVDSSEMAFKIAGSMAFKDAMAKAAPTLLEPLMEVEITTTDEFTGDIISDLSQRRGQPQGMDSQNGTQIIRAIVPMAEMLDYAPSLRSITQGRASFHMEFARYQEVPKNVQEKLIADSEAAATAEGEG